MNDKVGIGAATPSVLDYPALVTHVTQTFAKHSADIIFRTVPQNGKEGEKPASANSVYLAALPAPERVGHNCFTCRDFFRNYSDLVIINKDGTLTSAVWDPTDCPEGYESVVTALKHRAESGRVSGRFFTGAKLLGTAETNNPTKGSFEHFHITANKQMEIGVETVGYMENEANVARELFSKSLGAYTPATLDWAIHQFKYDASLYTRPAGLASLERFKEVQTQYKALPHARRQAFIWLFSQTLPGGVATLVNTALGTYLIRIQDAKTDHARRYARDAYIDQTRSENYMHATTESSEGQLDAAEKLIEKLGVAASLERRAATLSDIQEWVWQHPEPEEDAKETGGVFDRLRKQTTEKPNSTVSGTRIDWGRFVREILPQAKSAQVEVPQNNHNYGRMITAVHPDAPPIVVWDDEECRNPVSWYIYNGGSPAAAWNLSRGSFVKLTGVVATPSNWNGKRLPNLHEGHMLVMEGAIEQAVGTLGLFPEILKRELYPARNAIENLSRNTPLVREDKENEFAGIIINKGMDNDHPYLRVLVELPTGFVKFDITRWVE
jgi:hypothetical protein